MAKLRGMARRALRLLFGLGLLGCTSEPPVLGSTLAEGAASAARGAEESLPAPLDWQRMADAWVYPRPIPSFPLVDQTGRSFVLGDLRHGHVLVGFIFTHCSIPTACARTVEKMRDVGRAWKARGRPSKLTLLTLTFDPEVDTPEVLASYSELLRRELPDWIFATGPVELLEKTLPGMFGVVATRQDDTLAHSVKVALLAPGLRPMHTWTDNAFETDDVLALLE